MIKSLLLTFDFVCIPFVPSGAKVWLLVAKLIHRHIEFLH